MDADAAILVQVSASGRTNGRFRLCVTAPTWATPEPPVVESTFDLPPLGAKPAGARQLAAGLYSRPPSPAGIHLRGLLAQHPSVPICLELTAQELYSAPWERVFDGPPFGADAGGRREFFRYSPDLADMALVPLEMPVDVILAQLVGWPAEQLHVPHALKHFRTVAADRVGRDRLASLLRSSTYDVVHLRARAVRDDSGPRLDAGPNPLATTELRRLLSSRGCAARLVILETDKASYPASLEIAHSLFGRTGPAILVAQTGRFDFNQFYYDVTHNTDLVWSARQNQRGSGNAALLFARGGDEALMLMDASDALRMRVEDELKRATATLEEIGAGDALLDLSGLFGGAATRPRGAPRGERPASVPEVRRELDDARERIDRLRGRPYLFDHESAGIDPMSSATEELDRVAAVIERIEAPTRRVVNTWFSGPAEGDADAGTVPTDRSLATETRYRLHVMVGPALRESNIARPVGLPEEQLTALYRDGELPVRVVLFSSDFEVPEQERILRLPQPPAASQPVVFDVVTPRAEGRARLRVGLYYRNNLLQSVMITATISAGESRTVAHGNEGHVEWALSGSLKDLDRFEEKTVSILTNESPNGTHALAVVGTDFRQAYEFGELEVHGFIDQARGTLQWICGDPDKQEEYRFDDQNRGKQDAFREHLAELAHFGYDLYLNLLGAGGDEFEQKLQSVLTSTARIQAVWMKSAKRVFPWALVYDHPLIFEPGNQVCPDFLKAIEGGADAAALAKHQCFVAGCAHRDDPNIVCPSGFWGFRHVIEQPLSTLPSEKAEADATIGTRATDAVDTIPIGPSANLLLGYSKNLDQYEQHRAQIEKLAGVSPQSDFDLFRIGKGLQRVDLNVVYFYCHGGNKHGKPWLGVGAQPPQQFYSQMLHSMKVNWPAVHPLVFINGCNTVGISPDDLLTFNERFARSRAAGVIGTEISIPETLGSAFGRRFLEGFLKGEPVGELIRRLRLELLAGYNPLGLAYTPYCLANLRVVAA